MKKYVIMEHCINYEDNSKNKTLSITKRLKETTSTRSNLGAVQVKISTTYK